jgi:hypothetical protein
MGMCLLGYDIGIVRKLKQLFQSIVFFILTKQTCSVTTLTTGNHSYAIVTAEFSLSFHNIETANT